MGADKPKVEEKNPVWKDTSEMLFVIYNRWFSVQDGDHCEFKPVCSEYARQSIQKCGFFRGVVMGADRLMRDNPFVEPYKDPVVCPD